jgi:hypothetical protein
MDYMIDLSELLENNYDSNSIFYALTLDCSTLKNNFGEKCMISSTILFNLYDFFFSQKNILLNDIPPFEKIEHLSTDLFCFLNKNNYLINLIPKINENKSDILFLLNIYQKNLSKFSRKSLFVSNSDDRLRMIDEGKLYERLFILPFIKSEFLLNMISRYGKLNKN